MNNNAIPKFNGFRAFIGAVLGTLLGALPMLYFEFRDGEVNLLFAALCGLLAFGLFAALRGRLTGFRELFLMALGSILVLAAYELFINTLRVYESGLATTPGNVFLYMSTLSSKIRLILNNLQRGLPVFLVLVFLSAIFVDPVVTSRDMEGKAAAEIPGESLDNTVFQPVESAVSIAEIPKAVVPELVIPEVFVPGPVISDTETPDAVLWTGPGRAFDKGSAFVELLDDSDTKIYLFSSFDLSENMEGLLSEWELF